MSREALENSNTFAHTTKQNLCISDSLFMQRLQVGENMESMLCIKSARQSRANIHYRGMKCNELPCSVVGSLKKGRRAKHLI